MGNKKALIFGVTGQDGSYLANILLDKEYDVYGMIRKSATGNKRNIKHLVDNPEIFDKKFFLCHGDLADPTSIYKIINHIRPDEIYNEADQYHVGWSFDIVGYSTDITGASVGRVLEIIRQIDKNIKYFHPLSSNMFGEAEEEYQNEKTAFRPKSVYACAKIFAYYLIKFYRETYNMFLSTAIFYNHESPRRSEEYVTRKISKAAALISLGKQDKLKLGDLNAKIDWGYAKEYMHAAWEILQLDIPDDFVIGTGEAHSVREFVDEAFSVVNLKAKDYIEFDQRFTRAAKNDSLIADITKAQDVFGFTPRVRFKELVKMMVEADLECHNRK